MITMASSIDKTINTLEAVSLNSSSDWETGTDTDEEFWPPCDKGKTTKNKQKK